ncbi:alpha-glucosidase [Chitinophaga niastensis]|uniref:Alpha-glucosidase n=1 Tax=Chitinophaga niastensis TaxID=536980 RepID=A0A2P8HES7_CHINA|nr:glycoside hydrolase family 97 protein [Chitinophaga niastensis]PSL44728.1 alpha-glucosidase [Chitinophaga niastensis]
MPRILFVFFYFIICIQPLAAQQSRELTSPDGQLTFSFSLSKDGVPRYAISYKKNPIVISSSLGSGDWEKDFVLSGADVSKHDTVWKPVYGERSQIRDHYEEMTITLLRSNNEKQKMQLQVRAYNEGIAFRYYFPEHPQGGIDVSIQKELTDFTMPEGTKAWFTNRAQAKYSLLPLSGWTDESERPLVLQLPNKLYACLAEAGMVNYSRTKFALNPKKANTISCSMYDRVDFFTPFATPWRVVMVAERPGQLLENNDLILNLNPPCEIANTSWIQPGKVMREMSLSMKGARELVDFAVKRHLQYIHFDAGWYGYEYVVGSDATKVNVDPRRNPNSDLNLQEVIRYANEKGIGVFLYVNQRALYNQLDEILPLFKKWGVRGIKFGFVEVGSYRWTAWLHDAVKKCAEYKLMVDIHDEYRPTGFSRTYPNLLTQEGVYGNEEMPDATHNTTLPFTRFIAGAADYTICYYQRPELKASLRGIKSPHSLKTTSGHQLALSMIYYSPLQFLYWYDKPSDVQDEPELEFFDKISTVWDDTKVLDGEIAQYITIARRKGEEWFVGTITNNEARELKISFSFLPQGKKFEASIYADDPMVNTRTKVAIRRIKVDASTVLDTRLLPSGGQAIWIKPLPK